MPILNKAKGVYRGRALVKTVTVGTKKIWPSRTITGYRVVAEFTVSDIFMSKQIRVKDNLNALKPYIGVENMQVRKKGKSKSLAATVKSAALWVNISVKDDLKYLGIRQGTVCELLAPIYAD